jgi:hypothetical protein
MAYIAAYSATYTRAVDPNDHRADKYEPSPSGEICSYVVT